ncbi:MAG TPA: hypothetical protein VLL48_13925, partial [Longimicrobiales bacterium]|nr:hypothetical protein [Longimicrobiales bacterium]
MRRPDLTCLVMMPFDPAFDDVYAVIRTAVVEGAGDVGAACQRLDEMKRPGRISEELVEALEVTDLCVADLTGGNPNVMWEVGYAMALEKPIVFISQGVEALPFDL